MNIEKNLLKEKLLDSLEESGYTGHMIEYDKLEEKLTPDINEIINLLINHMLTILVSTGVNLRLDTPTIYIVSIYRAIMLDTHNTYDDIYTLLNSDTSMDIETKLYRYIEMVSETPIDMISYYECIVNIDDRVILYLMDRFKSPIVIDDSELDIIKELALTHKYLLPKEAGMILDIILNVETIVLDRLPINESVIKSLNLTNEDIKKVHLYLSLVFSLDIIEAKRAIGGLDE